MTNRYENYTESQLINEAIAVQNACNLSGVVHSFSKIMDRLWKLKRESGESFSTTDINRHRICRLFASKIQSLTGDVELGDFDELK